MLYRPIIAGSLSGKLNSIVASHNGPTEYLRALGEPIYDPQTANQLDCRQALSNLWAEWRDDLDPEIRDLWYRYGATHPDPDRIGNMHPLKGWPAYVRQNYIAEQINVKFNPTLLLHHNSHPYFDGAQFTFLPYAQEVPDTTKIGIVYQEDDNWTTSDDNGFAVYVSPLMPPTRLRYTGPMLLIGYIRSSEENPPDPASPAEFSLGYETSPGWHIFLRINFFGATFARQGPWCSRLTIA